MSYFFVFFFSGLLLPCVLADKVLVHTENGPIVGETVQAQNRHITRFLGIPYAQPPVGKLRFRAPVPAEKWSEPVQATQWPPKCVQNLKHPFNVHSASLALNANTSEDCLYLNIWSPHVNPEEEQSLLPVIVYLHGGVFIVGSSSLDLYDGQTLAAFANAVVVTINYRLSILGFLYSDEVDDIKGNQALKDQALALEWIQEHIHHFGGDKKLVSLMGESAGGKAISIHMLSPVSRHLFRNAIIMSGVSMTDKVFRLPDQLVSSFLTGIRKVGCATDNDTSISKSVVECMESLDAEQVDQVLYLMDRDPLDIPALVAVDGQVLPENVIGMLAHGDFQPQVNLLISTTENEGNSFLTRASPKFRRENPEPVSLEEAQDILIDTLSNHILHKPVSRELVSAMYFKGLNDQLDDQNVFRGQAGHAYGDWYVTCPSLEFAKYLVRSRPESNVYQWLYRAHLGKGKLMCPKWSSSACHHNDVYPVFGVPLRKLSEHTNRERDVSREVMSIVASFIRTGKPDNRTHKGWLPYFKSSEGSVIAPYYEIGNEASTHESVKLNLRELECSLIWNKYIYRN